MIALVLMVGLAGFFSHTLGWVLWVILGLGCVGLAGLLSWKSTDEGPEGLQESLIRAAREAMEKEMETIDQKRREFAKMVMAYGEWLEFPNFEELKAQDWVAEVKSEKDSEIRRLVDAESDRMLAQFTKGAYWEGGVFQHRLLMGEVLQFVESIAKTYQPESTRPLLETNLEAVLKAINRASLHVILLLEELPLIDLKDYNLRKLYEGIRRAGNVYKKYEEISPLLEPVRYLWQTSKFLLTSNPVLAAGWIAGTELARYGTKKIGKKMVDAYLLSLVRQSLRIIATETATIFDRTHRYRDPDWVYGVELTHLVSAFPLSRETLRGAFRELGKVPLASTYDRIFLYRCLAQHISPKPQLFAQADLLPIELREQLATRLTHFFKRFVHGRQSSKVLEWKEGVEERLQISLDVEVIEGPHSRRELIVNSLESLASFLHSVTACRSERVVDLLRSTQLYRMLSPEAGEAALRGLRAQKEEDFFFPDLEPSSDLVKPYLEDICDLDARVGDRSLRSYWVAREAAEYFRFDGWKTLERRLAKHYAATASRSLVPESPERAVPESLAYILPEFLEEGERPSFLYREVTIDHAKPNAQWAELEREYSRRFLVGTSANRVLLFAQNPNRPNHEPEKTVLLWEADSPGVQASFEGRLGVRDCILQGGLWHFDRDDGGRRVRIPGMRFKSQRGYLAALRDFLGIAK